MKRFQLFLFCAAVISASCQHPSAPLVVFTQAGFKSPAQKSPPPSAKPAPADSEKISPLRSSAAELEAENQAELRSLDLSPLTILPLDAQPANQDTPDNLAQALAQVKALSAQPELETVSVNAAEAPSCGLACQTELALAQHLPLNQQQWLGAHNAYNSKGIFKNQSWNISQQLDAGVRIVELDLHRRLFSSKVRVCHGAGAYDCLLNPFGARDYQQILNEVKSWSDQHPDQLLVLELENHVKNQKSVEEPILNTFQGLLYRAAERKAGWQHETPAQIVARGKRVIVADFGELRFEGQLIWDQNELSSNTPTKGFSADCSVDGKPMETEAWGFYDDKTFKKANPLTVASIPQFLRCDARYLKIDRLTPELLNARHFSWESALPEQACAQVSTGSGRWQAQRCEHSQPFVCKTPAGWKHSTHAGTWKEGAAVCTQEFGESAAFEPPRTYFQNQQVLAVLTAGEAFWINARLEPS
ncbi:hypothetical protein COW36_06435 [bacterium (Candidatus Blackallbacteria) CG17_big_fil_post_rev_8_21_14_2_50_48_46]|uniref:C-type lectin domain-containing protein n=1 Tax=bacterium (Candidatus Blackallbacteria) CG17_big_fil_post_rev_8_21_14_2_50_48_46 TaxID=2014261 RepID=A0A2M7G8B6_9BACT|nr:MAG: hypothetical protein COW36_06435 [bacterium (Candidatus Blackallbacteria) CG17_big_fil_post_rev_8_21_14_2_50_48_46]